jgi:hypothetical protein
LSIRTIATATGLSSSRVHQLLHADDTRQIAQAVHAVLATGNRSEAPSDTPTSLTLAAMKQQLSEEAEVLGWCIGWLEQLMRGEPAIVNLRASSDPC